MIQTCISVCGYGENKIKKSAIPPTMLNRLFKHSEAKYEYFYGFNFSTRLIFIVLVHAKKHPTMLNRLFKNSEAKYEYFYRFNFST